MGGKEPSPEQAVALEYLLTSLLAERIDDGRFRAVAPAERRSRLFGGQVIGQVIAAAAAHLDRAEMTLRSVHCDFLRTGTPGEPIDLAVFVTSQGRTFCARRVEVRQGDELLVNALLRFHVAESGQRRHPPAPLPQPIPESLPDYPTRLAPHRDKVPDWQAGHVPVDVRFTAEPGPHGQVIWFRAVGTLSDDPTVHAAVAAYASDMTLLGVAPEAFGRSWHDDGVALATLDHAMWFHGSFRADEWTLYAQRVVSAGAGRALVEGSMYTADGRMVATVVQDGVLRLP